MCRDCQRLRRELGSVLFVLMWARAFRDRITAWRWAIALVAFAFLVHALLPGKVPEP